MRLIKLRDEEMSFKRWPRTLNEAFGPGSQLHVEHKRMPLREKIAAFAVMVLVGIGWYVLVAIKAGA